MILQNDPNSTLAGMNYNGVAGMNNINNNLIGQTNNNAISPTANYENTKIVPGSEEELSMIEKVKKMIIEQVLNNMMGIGQKSDQQQTPLYPSVQYTTHDIQKEQANPYSTTFKQTENGYMYESTQEYYEKTTMDFSASATINTPNGVYNIELNFSYTQEIYEKNSTAINFFQEGLKQEPMKLNLAGDDYSLKDLKSIDLVFDAKKLEEMEKENDKNQMLMKFLLELMKQQDKKQDEEKQQAMQAFMLDVSVYEKKDESYSLAAQTQGGVGMFFSHQKSESAYMNASYDSDGNFSFSAGYSSYESTTFALSV